MQGSRSGFTNPELARTAGKKGGNNVKKKYGPKYFAEIGQRGGEAVAASRGSEFFAEIGRRGGLTRAENLKNKKR